MQSVREPRFATPRRTRTEAEGRRGIRSSSADAEVFPEVRSAPPSPRPHAYTVKQAMRRYRVRSQAQQEAKFYKKPSRRQQQWQGYSAEKRFTYCRPPPCHADR